MKTLLLILLLIPMMSFGQGSIVSLNIHPTNPTEEDTIYIYADLAFSNSDCILEFNSQALSGNNIIADAHYCLGMLTAICYTTDTFKISPLNAGTYTFNFILSSGFGIDCSPGIVADDNYVTDLNVIPSSVGTGELNSTLKQLIKIVDVLGRETPFKPNTPLLYIYNDGTVERKMIIKE